MRGVRAGRGGRVRLKIPKMIGEQAGGFCAFCDIVFGFALFFFAVFLRGMFSGEFTLYYKH